MEYFTTPYFEAVTYGEGDYYVTAVYESPAGESGPSNVVYGEGFLLSNDDHHKLNTITLYPNPLPVNRQLQIDSSYLITKVSAYNILGKEVFSTTSNNVHFSTRTKGVYILKIETKRGTEVRKIIVK